MSQHPTIERLAASTEEFTRIRRDLHQHPELGFEEARTSAIVAGYLREWGYEVHEGVGGTGVVGVLRQGSSARSIGIRADMDALPIDEASGVSYASQHAGRMHACGHDGHTAILLCAARELAASRNFDGTLNLIFQPAEETLGGAVAMMDDGLFERFPCDAVYALHNAPGLPVGCFLTREGALTASSDRVSIRLVGVGGHGAMPHLQSIVARNVPSTEVAVVSVGMLKAGEAANVIPEHADLRLSVRATRPEVRELLKRRIGEITRGVAAVHGMELQYEYEELVPVLVNTPEETRLARQVLTELVGPQRLLSEVPSGFLGSEDFAWMLERRPGCYIALGNGDSGPSGCMVHNPGYDFNDAAIPFGAALWVQLVEASLCTSPRSGAPA